MKALNFSLPLLAALAFPSCSFRSMTSTAEPTIAGQSTSMPGAVGHQMAVKAELEFPREGWMMRSYVGRSVDFPQPVHTPAPRYPLVYSPIAREKDVWVAVVVDKSGKVQKADCLDMRDSYFARGIERTVKGWTFYPGTVDGAPEEFLLSVAIKFRIEPSGI